MSTTIDDTLLSSFENMDISVDLQSKTDIELLVMFETDISASLRKEIITEFYNRDKNLVIESINNVLNSYITNKSSMKKTIILWVINNKNFNFPIRIRCIETLEQLDSKFRSDDNYLNSLEDVMNEPLEFKRNYEVSTTFFWNVFKGVIKRNNNPSEYLLKRLCEIWKVIILDSTLQEEFRYKLLQSLCNSADDNIHDNLKVSFSEIAITNAWNDYRYYIYIIQFIIRSNGLKISHLDILNNLIITKNLNSNAKADIADFFLGIRENYSSFSLPENVDNYKQIGKEILEKIAFEEGGPKTIYNNSQNIHKVDVDSTINPFIEKLLSINIEIPSNEDEYDDFVEEVVDKIKDYCSSFYTSENQVRVIGAINRFILDNTLYSKYSVSLLNLLIRSYYYIQTHEYKDELMKRLCEELCDMADTCTTGHIGRLVNIFSGYDLSVSIPVEDEIKSCVYARLTKIIGDKPEDIRDLILDSMGLSEEIKSREKRVIDSSEKLIGTIGTYIKEDGTTMDFILKEEDIIKEHLIHKTEDPEMMFNNLLGKDISNLLDELRKEYSSIISEQDLDYYFRKAINLFQVGEGI